MRSAIQRTIVPAGPSSSCSQANRTSDAVIGCPSCQRASRSRKVATRRPSGAAGSSVTTRSPPFSIVGTDSASRGTSSSCSSRRTSVSVTAAATKRADGSSSNTVRGSPTSPTTTSRRAGGVVAHAPASAARISARKTVGRTVRSARRRGRRSDGLDEVEVVATADGEAHRVADDLRALGLVEAEPAEVIDLICGWLLEEGFLDDRPRVLRDDRLRGFDRPADHGEGHPDHDRYLGEPSEEPGPTDEGRVLDTDRVERKPGPTTREHRATIAPPCARTSERRVDPV